MAKIFASFKDKKFRYGTFSTLVIIAIVAVLVVVNIVVGQLNLTADLSANKQYTLSQDSKDILKNIDQKVEVYAVISPNASDQYGALDLTKKMLNEYAAVNSNIYTEIINPLNNPTFTQKYKTDSGSMLSDGSVVVVSDKRYKVLTADSLVSLGIDYNTYSQYLQSYNIEPQITNAIRYVLGADTAMIYNVTGHGEMTISSDLMNMLSLANYNVTDINLLTTDIPDDCDLLFMSAPSSDWLPEEAAKVKTYLDNAGHAVVVAGYLTANNDGSGGSLAMPNFDGIVSSYGVQIDRYPILDPDNNYTWPTLQLDARFQLRPQIAAHDITNALIAKSGKIFAMLAMPLETMSVKKSDLVIEPLLTTSSTAYAKTSDNPQSYDKESGDLDAPSGGFSIADAITLTTAAGDTKLVVMSSPYLLDTNSNTYYGGFDYDFVVSSVKWVSNRSDDIYISPKNAASEPQLTMTNMQAVIMIALSVVIIPLIIIGVGLFVWLRRRHS